MTDEWGGGPLHREFVDMLAERGQYGYGGSVTKRFRLVSEVGNPGAVVEYVDETGKPIRSHKTPSCNELAARIDALEQRLARLEKKP